MSPDISLKSDLLFAVMNFIEMENHARFSYLSTNNENWLKQLNKVRELRAKYFKEIEKEEDSQRHCFNKHTLSAVFRLFECGDKSLSQNESERAKMFYNDGYDLLGDFITNNWMEQEKEKKEENKKGIFDFLKRGNNETG